jgi:predicted regulator of Ras-like GTPase activity (Roadblock/LC7/MglB family)
VFAATLGQLVSKVPGALGAAVVSVDGLTLEAVDGDGAPVEAEAAAAEFASVCRQLLNVGDAMELGHIRELTVEGPDRTTLIRMLSPKWFVALNVTPATPPGQGRLHLRVAAPDLAREL